ncbi:TIGR00341 family protein [Natrinema soli]|uniref:TIGR00341 family protein n=1 Tax=Natrinema soli TaxID=1930624 RepID=A0ABD5SK91_9EURY|nr:TIGR00341 family protein [Natrinema soli]
MRIVEIMFPAKKRDAIVEVLEDENIDYVLVEEASHRPPDMIISFPLPTPAIEPVLDRLRSTGLKEDTYTVVVKAETVVSHQFEELEERYGHRRRTRDRIGRDELLARAREMMPAFSTYILLLVLSTVVATAGLLVNSPAVVVGSMVIAPLLGPAIGSSVASVLDESELFRRGVKYQAVGLIVAVIAAVIFASIAQATSLLPPGIDILGIDEIQGRIRPDFLSLVVALGAGIAGAWSLATGASTVVVGVMIAAALVPPLAVIGIGIAFGLPRIALSASVLVLVNIFTINLTALGVLWYQGYQPEEWFQIESATRATKQRVIYLVIGIVILSSFLTVVTYDSYRTAMFETQATEDVSALIDTSYEDLDLIDVEVQYTDPLPFQQPERIIVTVGISPDTDPPPLAQTLEEQANVYIPPAFDLPGMGPVVEGKQVDVEVEYVQRQS